jgi:hypothetical protein
MVCTPACWTPVLCPTCGSPLPPRARDIPPGYGITDCCDRARTDPKINPRHLWDENDSDRAYFDPDWVPEESP